MPRKKPEPKLYAESTPRKVELHQATPLIHALIQEELTEHPKSEVTNITLHFPAHWSNEKSAPITTIYFKWPSNSNKITLADSLTDIHYSKAYPYTELKDHERRLKKAGTIPRRPRSFSPDRYEQLLNREAKNDE